MIVAVIIIGVVICMVGISQIVTLGDDLAVRVTAAIVAAIVGVLLCAIFVTPYA